MTDRIIKSGIERRHYLDSSFHDGQFMILSITIKILSIVTDKIINDPVRHGMSYPDSDRQFMTIWIAHSMMDRIIKSELSR